MPIVKGKTFKDKARALARSARHFGVITVYVDGDLNLRAVPGPLEIIATYDNTVRQADIEDDLEGLRKRPTSYSK